MENQITLPQTPEITDIKHAYIQQGMTRGNTMI